MLIDDHQQGSPDLSPANRGRAAKPIIRPQNKAQLHFHAPPQFQGPPIPREVEKMKLMSARDRVEEGYRMMKSMKMSCGSAVFKSHTERNPYNVKDERPLTKQMAIRDAIVEQRKQELISRTGRSSSVQSDYDQTSARRSSRSSSWARDTTPRGTYLFNWTNMPQCIPKRHIDPSPGPGAYTPALHFVGGSV